MAETDRAQEIIRELVSTIEFSFNPLHRYRAPYDCCRRLKMGLGFSKPEDCDCGLDKLLTKARDYTGDEPSNIPGHYYKHPPRWNMRSPHRS